MLQVVWLWLSVDGRRYCCICSSMTILNNVGYGIHQTATVRRGHGVGVVGGIRCIHDSFRYGR